MKFEYTSVFGTNAKGRLLKRPLVELELIGKNKNIKALGLLDSGADTTLINLEYAKALDAVLDTERKKEFIGISGARIPCYLSSITLKVKHFDKPVAALVAFIFSIFPLRKVGCMAKISSLKPSLFMQFGCLF